MALAYFNTLEYVKLLLQVDFSQKQAEALNEAQMIATQAVISQVATQAEMQAEFQSVRTELRVVQAEMQAEFQSVRTELRIAQAATQAEMQAEFKSIRAEFRAEIKETEDRLLHRIKDSETNIQSFVFKGIISTILANFAIMGIGIGSLAFIL